jgi:hypothetical protein
MAGRKRKLVRREKNGRAVRTPLPDPRGHVIAWPCRQHLDAKHRLSEKAASPLGGLNLLEIITDDEYQAGVRFAKIVHKYRATIDGPNPAAGGVDRVGGQNYIKQEECERRRVAYDAAHLALQGSDPITGQRRSKAVRMVAVYGESCPAELMECLCLGLSALAAHFGLTSSRKSVVINSRSN